MSENRDSGIYIRAKTVTIRGQAVGTDLVNGVPTETSGITVTLETGAEQSTATPTKPKDGSPEWKAALNAKIAAKQAGESSARVNIKGGTNIYGDVVGGQSETPQGKFEMVVDAQGQPVLGPDNKPLWKQKS